MILSRAPLRVQALCVRLACIRHAASVRPEPGSNSSLYGLEGHLRDIRTKRNGSGTCASSRFSCEGTSDRRAGHGRIKNQEPASACATRTPGDVSSHSASAFRERERSPRTRVVASIARAMRRRREQRAQYSTIRKACQIGVLGLVRRWNGLSNLSYSFATSATIPLARSLVKYDSDLHKPWIFSL